MDDGPLLVPRVKVAEDGSIILDEERYVKKKRLCFHENKCALSIEIEFLYLLLSLRL